MSHTPDIPLLPDEVLLFVREVAGAEEDDEDKEDDDGNDIFVFVF